MTINNYKPSENCEYMSEKMIYHYKSVLLEEAEFLKKQIKKNTDIATQKNDAADQLDQASIENERNMGTVTRERDLKKLKDIKNALNRIRDGDFGYCMECGVEIGIKRLNINPSLQYCFDCADMKEKTSQHYLN